MLRSCLFAASLLAAAPALAQSMHSMPAPTAADTPSTKAYREAMMSMDQHMAITYSGDPDKDFVAGMIPHHQGAVAMAKVELQYGKDAELRKLAQDIIGAQDKEIAFMKAWQAKHVK
jgi:uncharacterized protein (DUF305 family)